MLRWTFLASSTRKLLFIYCVLPVRNHFFLYLSFSPLYLSTYHSPLFISLPIILPFLSLYLSFPLFISLPIIPPYLSLPITPPSLSLYLSLPPLYLSTYHSPSLSLYLSFPLFIFLPIIPPYLSFYLSFPPIYLSTYHSPLCISLPITVNLSFAMYLSSIFLKVSIYLRYINSMFPSILYLRYETAGRGEKSEHYQSPCHKDSSRFWLLFQTIPYWGTLSLVLIVVFVVSRCSFIKYHARICFKYCRIKQIRLK